MQTKISQKKSRLYDDKGWVDAYILQDGGYIAFQVWQDDDLSPLFATCAAYGHPTSGEACLGEYTEEQCNDVANFYTLLSNKVCHGHVGTYSCELGCD